MTNYKRQTLALFSVSLCLFLLFSQIIRCFVVTAFVIWVVLLLSCLCLHHLYNN